MASDPGHASGPSPVAGAALRPDSGAAGGRRRPAVRRDLAGRPRSARRRERVLGGPSRPARHAQPAGRLLYDWRRSGILVQDAAAGAVVARPGLRRPRRRRRQPVGVPLGGAAFGRTPRGGCGRTSRRTPRRRAGRLELMRHRPPTSRPCSASTTTRHAAPREALQPLAAGTPAMQVRTPTARPPLLAGHRRGGDRVGHEAMADREIIIADGHHRYETALAYRDERRVARRRPRRRPALRLHPHASREPARRGARHLSHPSRGHGPPRGHATRCCTRST